MRNLWKNYLTFISISSFRDSNPPGLEPLISAARENPEKFNELGLEILKNPDDYLGLIEFPEVYKAAFPEVLEISGEKDAIDYCEELRNRLEHTAGVLYYPGIRKYRKWLSENYIPWRPQDTNDPNKTYTQWKKERYIGI